MSQRFCYVTLGGPAHLPRTGNSQIQSKEKKPPVIRFPTTKARIEINDRTWHNGGDIEIGFYARSLHEAARTLIATLDLTPNPRTAWDACPVVLLYRQAVELQLKSLVGEGSNFLKSPTDHITLYKTHSLRWLAQIVCQIIKAAKWENEFKCEGVSSLADFSALVNELEELDRVAVAVRPGNRRARRYRRSMESRTATTSTPIIR